MISAKVEMKDKKSYISRNKEKKKHKYIENKFFWINTEKKYWWNWWNFWLSFRENEQCVITDENCYVILNWNNPTFVYQYVLSDINVVKLTISWYRVKIYRLCLIFDKQSVKHCILIDFLHLILKKKKQENCLGLAPDL